jgi:hypothetical protein
MQMNKKLEKLLTIHRNDSGQLLSLWLTAIMATTSVFMGTAYDMSNAWVHKQWADAAAEASCTAGAMDMQYAANAGTQTTPVPAMNFLTSTSGDCAGNASSPMCYYARLNGYSSSGVAANSSSNDVTWNLSATTPANVTPSAAIVSGLTPNGVPAYLNVSVTENVPVTFMGIFAKAFRMSNSWRTVQVVGHCNCGLGSGGSANSEGAQEQTFTGQCPIANASFSSEWDIASESPDQLRTTGTNDPTDWVNFQCNSWTNSQGTPEPQSYLTTIPHVTIDGVSASIDAATQGNPGFFAVIGGVAFIANNDGFSPATPYGPNLSTLPYLISGETFTGLDIFVSAAGTGNFPYYTAGSQTTMFGISQSNMLNALSSDQFFGFSVWFQGNGERIFVGGGFGQPPFVTVYYHTAGYYVATFSND